MAYRVTGLGTNRQRVFLSASDRVTSMRLPRPTLAPVKAQVLAWPPADGTAGGSETSRAGLMPDGPASTLVHPGNARIVNMSERSDRLAIFAKGSRQADPFEPRPFRAP
jgi:hypothetical protein